MEILYNTASPDYIPAIGDGFTMRNKQGANALGVADWVRKK